MKKKYLIAASIAAASFAIARKIKQTCHTTIIDFTNTELSDKWNPLNVLKNKTGEEKESAARILAETILTVCSDHVDKDELDLLSFVLLYIDSTEDNTIMHVIDFLAEMASLGDRFELKDAPDGLSRKWKEIESSKELAENLLTSLEKLGCEKYKDILTGEEVLFYPRPLNRIKIIESEDSRLLTELFARQVLNNVRLKFDLSATRLPRK